MKRVVVIGAGGMLGHKVCQVLQGCEVVGLVRGSVDAYQDILPFLGNAKLIGGIDVLDSDKLGPALGELSPCVFVNCVGLVKQLEQASDPQLGIAINALLPHQLAHLCQKYGSRLIHISTDCVFDGTEGSYTEADMTTARDFYGRTKALGETLPNESHAVTLRTSFIGRELKPQKHGLVEWFLGQEKGTVDGFASVIYSGLTSLELARVIQIVVDRKGALSGVYHVASSAISKYHLLRLIQRIYNLDIGINSCPEPVCDRSLLMGPFTHKTGYKAPSWETMVSEMHNDPTRYEDFG